MIRGISPLAGAASRPGSQRGYLCLLLVVWFAAKAAVAEPLPEQIYRSVLPGVMTLEVKTTHGDTRIGTAFLAIKEGTAVTAWHVLHDAKQVTARFSDGETALVEGVVDWDEIKDIALLSLPDTGRRPNGLCLTNPAVGSRAYVIGAPMGYGFSFTDGLVSQVQVIDGFPQYQTSCPISRGNSGGPLLNSAGEVLGVISWSKNDSQNLNFATPARCLMELDTASAPIPWKDMPRERKSRQRLLAHRHEDQKRTSVNLDSPADLRQALQKSAGRKVIVTIEDQGERHVFHIRVSKDNANFW